ncbi:unnamed protein product [Mytilus coruscus]|uniref:Essential protein Yae1 N-terminal domain-containing protein n=1 Tax=Mytilus coruscus TaxID=42192 RepID=A0A6J8F5R3_MYTCO|nr:unnamed protein product [Mytilus coruscus]
MIIQEAVPMTMSQSQGYEAGFEAGKQSGYDEGFRLGWEKGSSIASEVGFYHGFIEELQTKIKDDDSKQRAFKVTETLLKLITELSLDDPTNTLVFEKLENIRAKFKQVMSLLGMKADFNTGQENGQLWGAINQMNRKHLPMDKGCF